MRIVHIIIGMNVGGAEIALERLASSHQVYRKYEHVVISLTVLGVVGKRLSEKGVVVHSLGLSGIKNLYSTFIGLRKLLRRLRPDIVQTWMYHADLIGGLAARSIGIKKIIWNVRSTDISKGGSKITLGIRRMCGLFSRILPYKIVFVGNESQRVHAAIGYDCKRSLVIHNGFNLTDFKASYAEIKSLRNELGVNKEGLLIGFVGRAEYVKGPDIFVEALASVFQKIPNLSVLMVGKGMDANNHQLLKNIESTRNTHRFHLLGQRHDVAICLGALDIFCLTSRSEGFPNALGEAMLMKRFCITTNVGDAAHLLGGAGTVVPSENISALSNAITEALLLTKSERIKLGRVARSRVEQVFSLGSYLAGFESLYEEVI